MIRGGGGTLECTAKGKEEAVTVACICIIGVLCTDDFHVIPQCFVFMTS